MISDFSCSKKRGSNRCCVIHANPIQKEFQIFFEIHFVFGFSAALLSVSRMTLWNILATNRKVYLTFSVCADCFFFCFNFLAGGKIAQMLFEANPSNHQNHPKGFLPSTNKTAAAYCFAGSFWYTLGVLGFLI